MSDSVLERADEIELVDVTADVLQQRLREGKVYVPEQAGRAISCFFRKGNLIALRELALRRTAERVDAQMRGYMAEQGIRETWAAGERLLVCVGPSRTAVQLVRATRRMAARLHADWIAVHVETPRDQRLNPAEREDILRALELAEQLGGRTVTLSGQSVADEILAYARDHNVEPHRGGQGEGAPLGGAPARLAPRGAGPPERRDRGARDHRRSGSRAARLAPVTRIVTWREYAGALLIVLVPTVLGTLLRDFGGSVPPIDAAMSISSRWSSPRPLSTGARRDRALVGVASFDFFSCIRLRFFRFRRPLPPRLLRHAPGGAGVRRA